MEYFPDISGEKLKSACAKDGFHIYTLAMVLDPAPQGCQANASCAAHMNGEAIVILLRAVMLMYL